MVIVAFLVVILVYGGIAYFCSEEDKYVRHGKRLEKESRARQGAILVQDFDPKALAQEAVDRVLGK